ncbi:MAG TPA: hypothetical protein PKZ12_07625, partial [Smithellaceae bacterium]|nr:hypothetical protein [Smithellaceae bacterium]
HVLQAWPPSLRTGKTTPAEFPAFLAAEREKFSRYDAADWMSQIKAIMSHDIAKDSGGDYGKIAAAMREKCLIITSPSDLIVYPQEAKSFARVIGAQTAEMDRVCGHFAFLCDQENLRNIVHKFMACHSGGCRKTEKNN